MTANVDTTRMERDIRQGMILDWVKRCFTEKSLHPQERIERLVEEVLELAQIEGLSKERLNIIFDRVNAKPPGEIAQEVGGISTTLLVYCESRGLSADACERGEMTRVLALPEDHFRQRHARKVASGLALSPDQLGAQAA